MFTLTLKDENPSGGVTNTTTLEFDQEEITVKELIKTRVYKEVDAYNSKSKANFKGLVLPKSLEEVILNAKRKKRKAVDPEEQFYVACDGFMKNAFFVIADARQLETLEEKIHLSQIESVSFIKLTPLIGG